MAHSGFRGKERTDMLSVMNFTCTKLQFRREEKSEPVPAEQTDRVYHENACPIKTETKAVLQTEITGTK